MKRWLARAVAALLVVALPAGRASAADAKGAAQATKEAQGKIQRYDPINRVLTLAGGQSFSVPRNVRLDNLPPGVEVTITYTVERGVNTIYEIKK